MGFNYYLKFSSGEATPPMLPAAVALRRYRPRFQEWSPGSSQFDGLARDDMLRLLFRIELLLRVFGISSVQAPLEPRQMQSPKLRSLLSIVQGSFDIAWDPISIQLTANLRLDPIRAELIDFSSYGFADRFDAHLTRTMHRPGDGSKASIFWTHDPDWIQPDSNIAVKMDVVGGQLPLPAAVLDWGHFPQDYRASGLELFVLNLVHAIDVGVASPLAVEHLIRNYVVSAIGRRSDVG